MTEPARTRSVPDITALEAFTVTAQFDRRPDPLGLGSALRRDAVLVKVTCDDGTVGWGEAFHGHAGTAVAEIVRTTMQEVVLGRRVSDTVGVNRETNERFIASAGMAGGFALALSGIDLAMWDAYGKHLGVPVHRLLGSETRHLDAYAGGFTLGYTEPARLVESVRALVERGFTAVKVRVGDSHDRDLARLRAVRTEFGESLRIMTDANLGLSYELARLAPAARELGVEWLEEPYPKTRIEAFRSLTAQRWVPVAAGETLAGAVQFGEWISRGALDVVQPDLSRVGGLTEALRIAALAGAAGLRLAPHISHTVINQAAAAHLIAAAGGSNAIYEADATLANPLRDDLITGGVTVEGGVAVIADAPGLGIEVREDLLADYPGQTGSSFPRPERHLPGHDR
ncbi:mandelate racemase/muconate lactonizing enzyme family protein [Nocardioides sp. DS6]|uniref:Mandelate racemase/muconate lactonizing enzyme family protein n=1 Tax=Nocardioides eburneus TaxID=3231482 RepID=A0ABV3T0B0_9ACTN